MRRLRNTYKWTLLYMGEWGKGTDTGKEKVQEEIRKHGDDFHHMYVNRLKKALLFPYWKIYANSNRSKKERLRNPHKFKVPSFLLGYIQRNFTHIQK
jgi:hypothetical protein